MTTSALPPTPSGPVALLADDLARQLAHWQVAAESFLDAEQFASRAAWESLEAGIGVPVRRQLASTVEGLLHSARAAEALLREARTDPARLPEAGRAVQLLRRRYVQVETTLDFFGQAVRTRTSTQVRNVLQLLDRMARHSIEGVLRPAGLPVPPVLTYVGEGLGASILRAGIRLWAPGTVNPVAAVKIVRHNLYRPTSLFHETGHQVAHLTGWNGSLAAALGRTLADDPALRAMWQPWSSEITADVHAFAWTGYASVAALYDVVADDRTILRWPLGDPHPVGWLRVLLGCAMCREAYGAGPWDRLDEAVRTAHPVTRAESGTLPLLVRSQQRIDQIAATCLGSPLPGLAGRPVTAVVDPQRVSPAALADLERAAGQAAWTSPHWRGTEAIRLVALAGLREAEDPLRARTWAERARTWMAGPRAA